MSSTSTASAAAAATASTSSAVANVLSKDGKSPLLNAWHDPLANIKTNQSCVKLVDLNCDGDSKLCICDYDKKMRVYKGTNLLIDYAILETPIAVAVTYMDSSLPRIPSIAVAAGSYVFLYRQLRPYRKWTCPPVEISVIESEIWSSLRSDSINPAGAVKRLTELRDTGTTLSYRSMELLAFEKESARLSYIEDNKDQPLIQNTLITCMDVLKKDSEENDAISLLVVGTEAGQLYILPQDPQNSNVLCRLQLPAAPSLLAVSGFFDVEWRITVLCRDGRMYSVKNGDVRGSAVLVSVSVDLGSQAVSLVKQDKQLWIALMDRTVGYYSARGKRLKTMIMQEDVAELSILSLRRAKVAYLLLVALVSGEIIMCKETMPLHSFKVDAPVIAVASGLYGREENSIAIVHGHSGSLTIKMWRRTVDVDGAVGTGQLGPPPEQDMPLPVPKKTKLFVEQTQREREHAGEIHRAFQRDLCKLRLTTARAYVQTLTDGLMTAAGGGVGSGAAQDIRISVQVQGLGPKFVLRVSLQNSGNHTFNALRVVFSFDVSAYSMGFDDKSQQSLYVPVLLPGPRLVLETQILCIDPIGRGGQILCLVYRDSAHSNNLLVPSSATTSSKEKSDVVAPLVSAIPLLSAAVKMPPAEPLLS